MSLLLCPSSKVDIVFDERLGVVDFHLSDKITAIFLTEAEMLNPANMRRKIVMFRKGLSLWNFRGDV